jgi:uncharacterized protein YeaO (DUF488 family)
MKKIDLVLKTGRISNRNISEYAMSGYLPIFICRFMNPLVKAYEGTSLHFIGLSPSTNLLMSSKNGLIDWEEYSRRYNEEMSSVDLISSLSRIYDLVKLNPEVNAKGAVLLCYCKDYTKCHRSLLANMINSMDILKEKVTELYV